MKKKYTLPLLEVIHVFTEIGIANSSALTKPQSSSDVMQEWETDVDENLNFSWE